MAENPLKIIDTFIFYNELDLLYYRFKTYYDLVGRFVLVESRHTFAGHPKQLYYSENKERFAEFADKIEHVIIEEYPYIYPNIDYSKNEQWENEYFHRNSIRTTLESMHLSDNDVVFVSDIDEFPDLTLLVNIRERKYCIDTVYKLIQDFYYYNLNTKYTKVWCSAYVAPYKYINNISVTLNDIRTGNYGKTIERGGWHLSYFGDSRFIQNKIQQFSHQEFNNSAYTDLKVIEFRMKTNSDLYGRPSEVYQYSNIQTEPYLPPNYDSLLRKFTDLPNIYVYIHITCINTYKAIVMEMIERMRNGGLYDAVAEIRVVLLTEDSNKPDFNELLLIPKVSLIYTGKIGEYEEATINRIDVPDNCPVLYLHSKGVTKPESQNITDWTNLFTYYLVVNWRTCLHYLNQYDTVGVNFHMEPKPHYSGNMWWTTGKHIRNLGKLVKKSYYDPEMYIGQTGTHLCLWESGVNHYEELYPPELYMCKINAQSFTSQR